MGGGLPDDLSIPGDEDLLGDIPSAEEPSMAPSPAEMVVENTAGDISSDDVFTDIDVDLT